MRRYVRFTLPAGELALGAGTLAWFVTDERFVACVALAAVFFVSAAVITLSIAWALGDFE